MNSHITTYSWFLANSAAMQFRELQQQPSYNIHRFEITFWKAVNINFQFGATVFYIKESVTQIIINAIIN